MALTRYKLVKAFKPHECSYCNGPIVKGEFYIQSDQTIYKTINGWKRIDYSKCEIHRSHLTCFAEANKVYDGLSPSIGKGVKTNDNRD